MADAVLVGLRSPAACGGCGAEIAAESGVPATFCRECGSCLLQRPGESVLHPLVPPRVTAEAAWERQRRALPRRIAARASLTSSRLVFVPYHEWAPDLKRTRVVSDARALLAPAADLLPAGLPAIGGPLGDGPRGLSIAAEAHRGRMADPRGALELIRQGEAIEAMIPRPDRPPAGGDPSSRPRLLHYPFWLLTYRVDWVENTGVVDAATGRPVGWSAEPSRWLPAAGAAAAGAAAFAVAFASLHAAAGLAAASTAGIISWAASVIAWRRLVRRERGR